MWGYLRRLHMTFKSSRPYLIVRQQSLWKSSAMVKIAISRTISSSSTKPKKTSGKYKSTQKTRSLLVCMKLASEQLTRSAVCGPSQQSSAWRLATPVQARSYQFYTLEMTRFFTRSDREIWCSNSRSSEHRISVPSLSHRYARNVLLAVDHVINY